MVRGKRKGNLGSKGMAVNSYCLTHDYHSRATSLSRDYECRAAKMPRELFAISVLHVKNCLK